jgi:hypothetical protein
MKKDLSKMIDVFKVQCRCVYQKRGGKEEIVYEDEIVIIDNFNMALIRFNYMVAKCNALGYYAKHDYWIKLRKCEILDNGLLDCGEVILQHLKGEKEFDKRRIVLKINPDLAGCYAIYDNKEKRFLEEIRPFYAFDTDLQWKGWETITKNLELQEMNNKKEEK